MATYYVSFTHGNDANNGLGPDASHATNKPWKTLAKVTNTGSTVVGNDNVYFGPDNYWGTTAVVPITSISSSGSPLSLRGDPTNAQGFKSAAGVLVAPGPIMFTTRASGDGIDGLGATGTVVTGDTNGTNGLKWYDVFFECRVDTSTSNCIQLSFATNADWLFERCRFAGQNGISYVATTTPTAARNLTVRACTMVCTQCFKAAATGAAATANADLNINFESTYFFGRVTGAGVSFGTNAGNKGGGVHWKGCVVINCGGSTTAITTAASVVSTTTPMTIEGCLVISGVFASIGTAGQLTDSGYNRFYCPGASSNFTMAGTSIQNFAPMLVWPDIAAWGLELPNLPWFSWGPGAVDTQRYSGWSTTIQDYRLRTARPWGPGASIGAFEVGKWVKNTASAITGGGVNSAEMTGAGEIVISVAVDAASTTISVTTKSTSYGGTNYPQLIVQPNAAVGVTQQTATATSATEQAISVTFTPTAKGMVEVRLISRSSSVSSLTYFDLLTAT